MLENAQVAGCHYCHIGHPFLAGSETQHALNVGGKIHYRPCRRNRVHEVPVLPQIPKRSHHAKKPAAPKKAKAKARKAK